jgi:hypothetical protein
MDANLRVSHQSPEFVSEVTQTPMVTQEPRASEVEKKKLFDVFKVKAETVENLKGKMLEKFPGLDSRNLTLVQLKEVQVWLESL